MNAEARTGPDIFVPRNEQTTSQGRWLSILARFQDVLLYVWLVHVCFVPQQFSSLVNFVALGALWIVMLLVGTWHLIKVPARRRLAAWTMAAFPLTFMLIKVLDSTVDVPLVGQSEGRWLFYGAVSVLPLYWLARWLLRTTRFRCGLLRLFSYSSSSRRCGCLCFWSGSWRQVRTSSSSRARLVTTGIRTCCRARSE